MYYMMVSHLLSMLSGMNNNSQYQIFHPSMAAFFYYQCNPRVHQFFMRQFLLNQFHHCELFSVNISSFIPSIFLCVMQTRESRWGCYCSSLQSDGIRLIKRTEKRRSRGNKRRRRMREGRHRGGLNYSNREVYPGRLWSLPLAPILGCMTSKSVCK